MDESDPRLVQWVERFTTICIAHSLSPHNTEELFLKKLQGLVTNLQWSPEDVTKLFEALLQRFESASTNGRSDLLTWMIEMLHCIEINYITSSSMKTGSGRTLMELVQDKTITDEKVKERLTYETDKTLDEILEEIRQEKLNQVDEELLSDVRDIVSCVHEQKTVQKDRSEWSELKTMLKKLCWAVEQTAKYKPRLTQMVSWCLLALSKTGRLIQVGTGEGKSCIVAMFAAYRALRGEKVDIMSSSPVLAERDLKDWRNFYKKLGISVDCNTNKLELIFSQDSKCYKHQVVYGTVDQFAGDWLRQHFNRTDTFGERTFQCAIVDEVDSLMLDKGHHTVYLGSDMPALQHLNPLLAFIWATANQYSKIGAEKTVGRKYPFHQVVLENIRGTDELTVLQIAEDTGVLAKGSVKDLRRNPNHFTARTAGLCANQLAEFFKAIERRFPSHHFDLYCLNSNGALQELNKASQRDTEERQRVSLLLINGGCCQYIYSDGNSVLSAAEAEVKRALHFTPCEVSQAKSSCYVPGFLSDLVESKLKVWIANAFSAQTMTNDHEYSIETHGIVPVDYSCTGVLENNMKWTDGLHQFLEMKHEAKLSDMTAITNFMSNVGLLQKYGNQIYGLSGTLGQQAETETLQRIYEGIKTCQIPSFKRRKLFEVEGVVVEDEQEWMKKICDVVTAQTSPTPYRGPRAVLVICETIKRAKAVHHALGGNVPNKKLYINNNIDNSEIFVKKLEAAEVIIATNLAGRGTDLKVSDEVRTAGGMFVVQTFLPQNARVEAQAFGRTARQGSPGSAQLIVCCSHLSEPLQLLVLTMKRLSLFENILDVASFHQNMFVMKLRLYQRSHSNVQAKAMTYALPQILSKKSKSEIQIAKEVRDESVAEELSSYLKCVIPEMKKKADLFNQYLVVLDEVYSISNNKPAASELSALNEFWGMWLLTSFNEKDSITDLKRKLCTDLSIARQRLRQRESPSSNMYHYIVFGNDLRENGNLAESIRMYTKAINVDHCWAAIAYYNRAFTSLIQQNSHQDLDCIERALEDLQNALQSVELHCEQLDVTQRYSKPQTKNLCSDLINRFDGHISTRRRVLVAFKENIKEATKQVDKARAMGGNVEVKEKTVDFLVPSLDFLQLVTLSMKSVHAIYCRDILRIHQLTSSSSLDILNELNHLKSLGLTHVYNLDARFSLRGFFSRIGRFVGRVLNRRRVFRA
ncbi:uncharacterized protein LOC103376295 [Stegastes partitus]|uniref:Uncharacterized protein LOC103376295 n=1 Tax=Stegastes partitus TaxID=144197 RepID=A0A9Y4NWY5_9TELE|nr:PREDICTED: uncharacterized protein LOC103376295 [Stegastes partitus]